MSVLIGIYIFVVGTIFASFFGVIINRVPKEESIITPSSRCDSCGHILKWYENIPIISYLILGGRCSKCKNEIGLFSFIYELLGGLALLFVYLRFGISIESVLMMFIVLTMYLIAGYDYKTKYILNVFLIVLIVLCMSLFLYRTFVLHDDYMQYVYSLIICLLFTVTIRLVMSKILKKEAMGTGDIYMFGILSLIFEPFELLLTILVASLSGSIISIVKIKMAKNQRDEEIPFCPYICLGAYVILMFGEYITNMLLR